MEPLGIGFNALPGLIREYSPDLVGISFMTSQYRYGMECFHAARKGSPDALTVAGGVHTSALPREVLLENRDIDFVVVGEGEQTLVELSECMGGGPAAWRKIRGLVFRDGEEIVINPPRPLIADLDDLPIPLWEELSKVQYKDIPVGLGKEVEVFPLLTGRGCPNMCNFCASGVIFHRKLRLRSVGKVFEEMEVLYSQYGARHFNFLDDTLTIHRDRLLDLCDRISTAGWNVEWRCTARVNTVDASLLKAMKSAGCRLVAYGVESGDQQILKNIRKNINLSQVQEAFRMTREAGLLSMGLFMVGNLGETWASVNRTIKFIRTLDADFVSCSILTPYPGTEIYEIVRKRGLFQAGGWDQFVPTPHTLRNFKPLISTEDMSPEEILKAYYAVIRSFSRSKITRSYGKAFYLNPLFYQKEVWNRIRAGGLAQFLTLVRRVR
jgi:radical SAM superfamily enzyme YgiQ (UPF0313 family)